MASALPTDEQIAASLRKALPPELHACLPELAHLLAAVAAGTLSPAAARSRLDRPEFTAALQALAGRPLIAAGMRIEVSTDTIRIGAPVDSATPLVTTALPIVEQQVDTVREGGTVIGTVVGGPGPLIIGGQQTTYYQVVERRPDRNRQAMLKKVRATWIDGLLTNVLPEGKRIKLDLIRRYDTVEHPLHAQYQEFDRPPQPVAEGSSRLALFSATGGALLILGAPGGGKTTLLLELASELLDQAERDPYYPIPVVFNLSSWQAKHPALSDWLVDELRVHYEVPRRIARAWVDEDALLPLLDGLDEVAPAQRSRCVDSINAYRRDHGLVPLAVCCRTADYEALDCKLNLQGSLEVQPLSNQAIADYLDRAGSELAGLRALLASETELHELATAPLLLNIMVTAYQDLPAGNLHTHATAADWRQHLFTHYVERTLTRRGTRVQYPHANTRRWLRWLAQQMSAQQQPLFLLEQMQPTLLPGRWWRALYKGTVLATSLLIVLAGWSLAGVLVALANIERLKLPYGILICLVLGAHMGIALIAASVLARRLPDGLATLLVVLLASAVWHLLMPLLGMPLEWHDAGLLALIFSLPGSLAGLTVAGKHPLQPVSARAWDRARFWPGLALGLGTALAIALVTALLASREKVLTGLVFGTTIGLCCLLPVILIGTARRETVEPIALPGQGVRRSLRRTALSFIAVMSVVTLIGIGGGFLFDRNIVNGIVFALVIGIPIGMVVAFTVGGGGFCLQHYLLRAFLALAGCTPWRYQRFLDYATDRVLLRRIGRGYIFYHRLLMDYFVN